MSWYRYGDPLTRRKNSPGQGTINDAGYKLITVGGKLVREHRHIMELKLGRPLLRTEEVHHIDENKLNNAIENLRLTNRVEHRSFHRKQKRTSGQKECSRCHVMRGFDEYYPARTAYKGAVRGMCKPCTRADALRRFYKKKRHG